MPRKIKDYPQLHPGVFKRKGHHRTYRGETSYKLVPNQTNRETSSTHGPNGYEKKADRVMGISLLNDFWHKDLNR